MIRLPRVGDGKIDFSGWTFSGDEKFNAIITGYLNEAFEGALSQGSGIDASLPWCWAPESDGRFGKAVENPLLIYFGIPLDSNAGPEWAVGIDGLIDEYIASEVSGGPGEDQKIRGKGNIEKALRLRDALLEQAAKLEKACETGGAMGA